MKKWIAVLLIFCFCLSGCGVLSNRIKEPVTFYYLCSHYQKDLCCVIATEEREAAGHSDDLSYLLALYRMGPTGEDLKMPLKSGVTITPIREDDRITLELSETPSMSDLDFSLACACLTLTCLGITDAETVTIRSADRIRVMDRSALILYDTVAETTPMEDAE